MKDTHFNPKKFILNLDQYIGAMMFITIMLLLSLQVISRYVFSHSLAWTEELSTTLFVWMTYLGVSSAVTYRKHLRIDALVNAMSFKIKRILLICSDVIFITFNTYLVFPLLRIINGLGASKSAMLGIPKQLSYVIIPVMLTISSVKLILDIVKLVHEQEKEIGASKPSLDLDACEREAKNR